MTQDKAKHYEGVLWAVHTLEYPYTRSVGQVIGTFLAGLKEGRVLGTRTPSGKVLVPPSEFDPETGADLTEIAEVSDTGAVTTWAWVPEPRAKHPLRHAFAWALIRLDGADTAMLHAVDAGDPARMKAGMRVKARWRDSRSGSINDIECFVPVEG
ncbi:MAG TPA: OB-fold domain-containing protein [Candidatus Limnocylindrales bacterium]|nr:OB-fold domain-containing protein [Candidatus Limnocylindrales bacterium]